MATIPLAGMALLNLTWWKCGPLLQESRIRRARRAAASRRLGGEAGDHTVRIRCTEIADETRGRRKVCRNAAKAACEICLDIAG